MLETGIPTIRNRNSGHGQGAEIKLVSYMALPFPIFACQSTDRISGQVGELGASEALVRELALSFTL
ncbi:DUF7014 domain-containing protein [Brenneria goodwinii]|uniref:DUF7014 domain-containing protein n=1 Tax=Brenneria goodwinii TaxID=1109412 RepID=UPI0035C6EA5D